MNIPFDTPESSLRTAIGRIVTDGVVSVRALRERTVLYEELVQGVTLWSDDAVRRCEPVVRICSDIGMDADRLSEQFIGFVFRADPLEKYPVVDGILTFAHCGGEECVIDYLTTALKHLAISLKRRQDSGA